MQKKLQKVQKNGTISISKSPVQLLLEEKISEGSFLLLQIPEGAYHALAVACKELIGKGKEISAENIWLLKKDKEVLLQYMEICNQIDKLKLGRKNRN